MCIYIDTPHIYCVTFVTPVTLKRTISMLRSLHPIDLLRYSTTPRNGNRANGNHLGICLSFSEKNGNSLAWVRVALTVCLPTLYFIESWPNLELASENCES